MTRNEFIAQLAHALQQLTESERNDILRDYQEYFIDAQQPGRSDDEIIATLGQPAQIAKQLTANRHLAAAKQQLSVGAFLKATLAVISLTIFNVGFVLGPLITIAGSILALWVVCITLVLSPAIYGIMLLFQIPVTNVGDIYTVLSTYEFTPSVQQAFLQLGGFLTLIAVGFGILGCIILYYLSRLFISIFIKYMQFNVSVLQGSTQL